MTKAIADLCKKWVGELVGYRFMWKIYKKLDQL